MQLIKKEMLEKYKGSLYNLNTVAYLNEKP